MYSDNKTVQILISLLKEFGVKHAVLSPGSRNVPIVHSIEGDSYFTCYSIVDERSAAYFAIGLSLELNEPVMISCTSATASTNYSSAICEAFEQKIPLVVLTSDRNQYYLNQLEDQLIPQSNLYPGRTKMQITLPIIKDSLDEWYCRRIINEALLEMNRRGGGPVHIDIPIDWGLFAHNFNTKILPKLKIFKRITYKDLNEGAISEINDLKSYKRILILYGQSRPISKNEENAISFFVSKYNCVISSETISNLHSNGVINTSLITKALTKDYFSEKFAPDLVISLKGNYVSPIKGLLKSCTRDFDHWIVNEEGSVVDQFKKLTRIFECSVLDFFTYFNGYVDNSINNSEYKNIWENCIKQMPEHQFSYSSSYVMQSFLSMVPDNSVIHYGNGVSVHLSQYFTCDESIVHYCHSGTTTIDGSLSSFIGQSSKCTKLCFAFIGDLSFFYDMNALWNRYVGRNVRILLYNNGGGQTFYWNNAKDIDTLPLHISAEHRTSAKGWVESLGFRYLSAHNQEEVDSLLPEFVKEDADCPILFEVFTKKDTDAKILLDYYDECRKSIINKI